MTTPSAKMWVLARDYFACIRIVGRANFNSSIDFRTLVNGLRDNGCRYFVLELSECVLMDSTFLGVLAGFGLKMGAGQKANGGSAIELRNPNARVSELLENLGVLHLFQLTQGSTEPDQTEICLLASTPSNKEEVTRACLEAHQTLMDVHPENVAKFKEVAQFLAEDLKKSKEP